MRKEDITRVFPSATDEDVKTLLDINSADITHALDKRKGEGDKLKSDLDAANAALAKAQETIRTLEATKGDTQRLQEEIERYKKADIEREEANRKATAQRELEERFNAVTGDRKFIHDLVRKGVMEDFGKALADKANRGKSDVEIFTALTRDQNYFASQNPPAAGNMPQFGANLGNSPDTDSMSDADYYASIFKGITTQKR